MVKRFLFEELDDATKQYLRQARARQGHGMAGVFASQVALMPWAGLICGLIVLGLTWWFTVPPLGDPLKTAMLQTAGLLLGGWMLLAAVRFWASWGGHHIGCFVYADGIRLWEGQGPYVRVTELRQLRSVDAKDTYQEGKYTSTAFTLYLEDGRIAFTISNGSKATEMYEYLTALAQEQPPEAAAQDAYRTADYVKDHTTAASVAMTPSVDIAENSPTPHRARTARSGIVAYVGIVVFAVFGVLSLNALNVSWGDDASFDLAKGMGPHGLQIYLMDPRNTRHREEAERLLAGYYDGPIAAIKRNAKDQELGAKMVALLQKIQAAPAHPLVSITVKDESEGDFTQRQANAAQVKKRFVDAISAFVGDDLIYFVETPEGAKPLLDFSFVLEGTKKTAKIEPNPNDPLDPIPFFPKDPAPKAVKWTVRIRQSAEEADALEKSWTNSAPPMALGWSIVQETAEPLVKMIGDANPQPRRPVNAAP